MRSRIERQLDPRIWDFTEWFRRCLPIEILWATDRSPLTWGWRAS